MSTTIDQRVVEMRFDNKHFEKNVSTTMSTLDKLKQALHLPNASKSLEGLSTAAKSVNMNGLGSAVETVSARFSALQVMGVTALANITNSAVNAGKNIVKALTIDPVTTGLSEYETKINAIQVIQANTRGKNTMDDIAKALDELNEYADKTIYNFSQMTSNIGKFTAQGFNVQDATNAVKGLANLAAASGASAEDMSRATYQMSQAMGSSIKLMDWNSLRNANMATQDLKDTLIALAKTHGIAIDQMIEDEGTFEYTLQNGWLTGEMFTEAMNIYSGVYSDAELAAKGFTETQIANFKDLAATAESAATEVKTFTQLWDVLKETAQSGWTQTWELLVGDFDTAKADLTKLQNYFSDIINSWSDARNTLFGGALDPKGTWDKITAKLDKSGLGKIKDIAESVSDVTDKLEHFQDVVNRVWRGDFGNSDTGRFELLEQSGYDHRVVQDLVNKGYNYKLTVEDIEASHKKFGLTLGTTAKSTQEVSESIGELSDEQLKNAGLTDAEIKLYRDLEAEAKRTGVSIGELVDEMSKADGRTLLIESFKNAWQGLSTILKSVKDAFVDVFPPMTVVQLYSLIKGLNEFSQKLRVSEETADKITRTFKGLFALLDIVLTIVGGPLKWGFDTLVKLLAKFDLNILDITASAGDAIVKFRDWIDENNLFIKGLEIITPYLKSASEAFRNWIEKLKTSKNLPEDIAKGIISGFTKAIKFIKSIFSNIGDLISGGFDKIPDGIISGLVNGLMNGAKVAWEVIVILGKTLVEKICEVLGIHSPSTEFFEIGKNIVLGLFNGIRETVKMVYDLIMSVAQSIVKTFRDVDPGTLIAAGLSAGMIAGFLKIGKALQDFTSPLEGVGDILENTAKVIKSFSGVLKSFSFSIKAKAIQSIAIALGILVGSVVVLSFLNPAKVWSSVGVLLALAGVMAGLSVAIAKFGSGDATDIARFSFLMLSLSASLLIIAGAVKILETVDPDNAAIAFGGLAGMVVAIGLVLAAYGKLVKGKSAMNIAKLGSMLFTMSLSLMILVGVIKLIGGLSKDEIIKGSIALTAFVGVFALLALITKLCGRNAAKLGSTLLKMSIAMGILVLVMKLIGSLEVEELIKGGAAILAFVGIFALLALITKIGDGGVAKLGSTLLGMAAAMLIMALVVRLVSGISTEDLIKGSLVILAFGAIITGLIWATKLAGGNIKGLGTTMLAMAVAIGILAGIAVLLSLVDTGALVKGIIAVGALGTIMALMVASTKNATSCVGNLTAMTIAIAVMAGAAAALSMIDTTKLAGATLALTVLMGMFAVLVNVAGKANGATGSLIVLTIAVGLLGGLLYLLSGLPIESTIGAAASLSLLLITLSGALFVLDQVKTPPYSAIGALAVLELTLLELGVILKLIEMMNIDVSIPVIASLSILLGVLVGVLFILDKLKTPPYSAIGALAVLSLVILELGAILKTLELMNIDVSITVVANLSILLATLSGALLLLELIKTPPMGAISALAVLSLVILELGVILKALDAMDINVSIETVTSLSALLLALSASLGILALVGSTGASAFVGIAALETLIVGTGAIIAAIGALVDKFPQLEAFLDKGIPILEKIGYGLGAFFGNIVGGFADGATAGLPAIGTHLTQFMENAQGFIDGAKGVDDQMMSGVKAIAEIILILTAADILDGLTSWFTGGTSLADFGAQLGGLGTNLNQFVTNLGTFSEDQVATVTSACNALKMLAETAKTIPNEGGVWASIVGDNSISAFGAQLGGLGTNLNQFVTNLGTFSEDQVATVTSACEALKTLASAAKTIPNEGGIWASIVGDNSISAFGAQLGGLGTNLNQFVTNLGTFSEDQVATVTSACNALKALADAAKAIPNEGGIWASIVGDNSISVFGGKLPGLGTNLASFVANLGTFSEDQVATVASACNAIKSLANMSKVVSSGEDIWDKLFGDNSLTTFSSKLPGLGTNLASFVANLGTFSEGQVSTVNSAVKAINAIAKLSDTDLKKTTKNISGFGKELVDLGGDISDFTSSINDGSAVTDAVDNLTKLVKSTAELAGVDTESISSFSDALKKLGDKGVESFIKAFTDSKALSGVKDAAKKFVDKAVDGIEDKKGDVEDAAEDVAKAGASAIKTKSIYNDWKGAGKYCVEGFAAGIKNNKSIATAAAEAVAAAALAAAKAKLKEHSPSKAFYEVGDYAGLGFVNALFDYETISYDAGSDMAGSAMGGLRDAISKIGNFVDSDIDVQPTISPVVDLTDVESKARSISSIFGEQSVGIDANVSAINTMMSRRNQNGANDDVISAIDKLGKHIDDMPRETFNVNGLTYTGESEVEDAIKTLIRYAKVERRV